ncbi:MAG TPA: hypothetical protein VG297_21425 [Bryobacteraceae bacterium]|nr:hypothetical protein [Bryobacteraceae bacterium]
MAFRKFLAIALIAQLICVAAGAQAPPQSQPPAPVTPQTPIAPIPTVEDLKVLVLEGQRSMNNTASHVGVQPVVEVRDQNDRPVEGATVVFRLPPSGAGGTFGGNSLTFTSRSNAQGQAAASGFIPNDQLGRFDIHVTATLQNRIGQATISETNTPNSLSVVEPAPKRVPLYRKKYFLIGVAAAVAVGVFFAVRSTRSSPAPNPTVTITPGPVLISQ